jgi:hypothetical protein
MTTASDGSQVNHGPASRVSAVPDDLASYSAVGLRVDRGLAEQTKAFWRAMYHLRPVAAKSDPRIPRIIDDGSNEENTAVNWLARAEQVDAWVAEVARAFVAAEGNAPIQGPRVKVTVLADNLDSAIAAGDSDAPTDLKLSGNRLRGPNGELFDLVVPPMTNASYWASCVGGAKYNALNTITPDDPTSVPQTMGGIDPGWTVVDTKFGMTSINKPGFWTQIAAGVSPPLEDFGEPAGPEGYRGVLEQLAGAGAHSPESSSSGGLPPDDPFLERAPFVQTRPQERVASAVDVLGVVNQSLGNVVHVKNGALAAYQTTYERNVDGRTRAVVRLYKVGTPPRGDKDVTHAYYGSVGKDGRWELTPITPEPHGPQTAIRNP